MTPREPVAWQEASLSTLSQGLSGTPSGTWNPRAGQKAKTSWATLPPGTNPSQRAKVTLSHVPADSLPLSLNFFLPFFDLFTLCLLSYCPSSLKVCCFLGIFPLGNECSIMLVLVSYCFRSCVSQPWFQIMRIYPTYKLIAP